MVGGNEPGGDVVFFLRMNVSEIGLTCIQVEPGKPGAEVSKKKKL